MNIFNYVFSVIVKNHSFLFCSFLAFVVGLYFEKIKELFFLCVDRIKIKNISFYVFDKTKYIFYKIKIYYWDHIKLFFIFVGISIFLFFVYLCDTFDNSQYGYSFNKVAQALIPGVAIGFIFYAVSAVEARRRVIFDLVKHMHMFKIQIKQSGNVIGTVSLYDILFGLRFDYWKKLSSLCLETHAVRYSRILDYAWFYSEKRFSVNYDNVDICFSYSDEESLQNIKIGIDTLLNNKKTKLGKEPFSELIGSIFHGELGFETVFINLNTLSNKLIYFIPYIANKYVGFCGFFGPQNYNSGSNSQFYFSIKTEQYDKLKKYINGAGELDIKMTEIFRDQREYSFTVEHKNAKRMSNILLSLFHESYYMGDSPTMKGVIIEKENECIKSEQFKKSCKI